MKKTVIIICSISIVIVLILFGLRSYIVQRHLVCGFNRGGVIYYTEDGTGKENIFGEFDANGCDILGRYRSSYFLNDSSGRKEVSGKEFYSQIDKKNKECNDCLKTHNAMID